jgi:hypothetical protein
MVRVGTKQLTPNGARQWIDFAGYEMPDYVEPHLDDYLRARPNDRYGHFDVATFYSRLVEYALDRTRKSKFFDYVLKHEEEYDVTITPAVRQLITHLDPGVPLFVADGGVTAEDLFCVSVLLRKEVGLLTPEASPWTALYVAIGEEVVIPGTPGYRFALHTHPSLARDTSQIAGDMKKPRADQVEHVVTGWVIFHYTRDHLFNETGDRRGEQTARETDLITRTTPLRAHLLRGIERDLLDRKRREDDAERARFQSNARPVDSGGPSLFDDFLDLGFDSE